MSERDTKADTEFAQTKGVSPDPATQAALGRMARAAAHDVNNVLAQVSGFAELIQLKAKDPAKVMSFATQLLEVIDRSQALTRKLSAVGRADCRELIPLDLATLLREVINRGCSGLELISGVDTLPVPILGDGDRLRRVFDELFVNAREAGARRMTVDLVPHGLKAQVICRDDGHGLDPSERARIFEPFVSTKEVKGHGFGLPHICAILTEHLGTIRIAGEPGQGATVVVTLPLQSAQGSK
ncbi:MAG: HAMP domain-containing sensor histidine kinase [Planctomycetota bacterium]|jgi:signal transduction histidine kinase|nr:HAMP domain-containing sensor histidine kinase [Planctomycetota bacterium]